MYIRDRKNEKREGKDGVWMRKAKAKERRHIWSAAGELRRGSWMHGVLVREQVEEGRYVLPKSEGVGFSSHVSGPRHLSTSFLLIDCQFFIHDFILSLCTSAEYSIVHLYSLLDVP
jgi:hypothetical protein